MSAVPTGLTVFSLIACCSLAYSNTFSTPFIFDDTWHITGIENFSDNDVMVFNRWGDAVYEAKGYNNNSVVWKGENHQGTQLPDGTYFWVIKYNGKVEKGWVEVTR